MRPDGQQRSQYCRKHQIAYNRAKVDPIIKGMYDRLYKEAHRDILRVRGREYMRRRRAAKKMQQEPI